MTLLHARDNDKWKQLLKGLLLFFLQFLVLAFKVLENVYE
jgi:hypothetical protein